MKRTILVMCAGLMIVAAHAQFDERDRVVTSNPLRNGDGSFVQANNPLYFNNRPSDTMLSKRLIPTTTIAGDPYAFRVNSLQALSNFNSTQLNWTSIQPQTDADHFEIEQSSDGGITWKAIGTVPALRSKMGRVPYSFVYNKAVENVDFRVMAINTAGERRYSSVVHTDISNLLSVDNLVYSTANVRMGSPKTQNVKMILTNQSGVVVQAREVGLTQGVNSISLDMSSLPQGYYVLTILWTGGRQESVKIMKQ